MGVAQDLVFRILILDPSSSEVDMELKMTIKPVKSLIQLNPNYQTKHEGSNLTWPYFLQVFIVDI